MNPFTLTTRGQQNVPSLSVSSGKNNTNAQSIWQEGALISAELLERKDGFATLQADGGITFQAAGDSVKGSTGETLTFQVIKNGKNGPVLKQITNTRTKTRTWMEERRSRDSGEIEITSINKTIETMNDEDRFRTQEQQEAQTKAARAVSRIRRAQQYMTGNAGKSAIAVLLETGLSMNKISFALFDRVLHQAEKKPLHPLSQEETNAALAHDFKRPSDAKPIIYSLHRYGLPLTDKNMNQLERAWEKWPTNLEDIAVSRLIQEESALTLENVYKSRFSVTGDLSKRRPAEEVKSEHVKSENVKWEDLAGEVQKLFKREGIEDSRQNRALARFLWDKGLPLNEANLNKLAFLQNIKENLQNPLYKLRLFDLSAEAMAKDRDIASIPLEEFSPRKIAEVQLKFTTEAAARLSDKNLAINTGPLRETLLNLNRRDEEAMARYLRMAEADDSPEPVSRMTGLFDTLKDLRPLTVNVHAGILQGQTAFTLRGVHESVLQARAQEGYEQFATVPNPHLGDSFNKVRTQFAPFLEGRGITASQENMKAAFILSRNHMEVNEANILAIKEIDAKINTVADKLHPMMAAQMLKDGLQPLDMHVDEVLAYIEGFGKVFGEDGSDKTARYIREMDDNRTLDEETRRQMISIYRMLHIIQKNGAAALGLALKMAQGADTAEKDTALTLGRLMELAKFYEKQARNGQTLDLHVDDQTGFLERIEYQGQGKGESIRSLLEKQDLTTRTPLTHTDLLTDAFTETARPALLRHLLEDIPDGTEMPLEDMPYYDFTSQVLEAGNAGTANLEAGNTEATARMQTFLTASPELMSLLQNRGIPVTAGMIKALEKHTRSPRALADALQSVASETDTAAFNNNDVDNPKHNESDVSIDSLLNALPGTDLQLLQEGRSITEVLNALYQPLENARILADSAEKLDNVEQARDLLALNSHLNTDGSISLPIKMNGSLSQLSLYVLNKAALLEDGARVLMSLDTATMGTVRVYFTLDGGAADMRVVTDSRQAQARLAEGRERLNEMFREMNLPVSHLSFETAEEPEERKTGTDTPPEKTADDRRLSEHEYLI